MAPRGPGQIETRKNWRTYRSVSFRIQEIYKIIILIGVYSHVLDFLGTGNSEIFSFALEYGYRIVVGSLQVKILNRDNFSGLNAYK